MALWVHYDAGTQGGWYEYSNATVTTTSWVTSNFTTTTCASSNGLVWPWVNDYQRLQDRIPAFRRHQPIATRAEIVHAEAVRAEREREYHAAAVARRALRASAEAQAEALLLRHLDAAQRQQYQRWGWFEVWCREGRLYRLSNRSVIQNVTRRDPVTRQVVRTYCAHPREDLPVQDVMLAQLLMLQTDEPGFLRVAHAR